MNVTMLGNRASTGDDKSIHSPFYKISEVNYMFKKTKWNRIYGINVDRIWKVVFYFVLTWTIAKLKKKNIYTNLYI